MTQDTICCALKRFSLYTQILLLCWPSEGGGVEAHQLVQRELNTVVSTDTITQLIPIGRHTG